MSNSSITIRYLLYGLIYLFVATGIVIISVGVAIKAYYRNYGIFVEEQFFYVPNFLIIIGISIFIFAFFGYCGAAYENPFMTLMFSSFLLIIFFLEITAGISGYFLRTSARETVITTLTYSLENAKYNKNIADSWAGLQEDFNCCGIISSEDWIKFNITTASLPQSCCTVSNSVGTEIHRHTRHFNTCNADSLFLHKKGCLEAFGDFLISNSFMIEAIGFSLALIQMLGIILSCHLCSEFRKGYEHV